MVLEFCIVVLQAASTDATQSLTDPENENCTHGSHSRIATSSDQWTKRMRKIPFSARRRFANADAATRANHSSNSQ
jgi:hypothetical protein